MREALLRLNKTRGVKGSLLVDRDGIVVAADLGVETPPETIGAAASQMFLGADAAALRLGLGGFRRFTVTGRDGRFAIVAVGPGRYLLALVEPEANLAMIWVAIREAAEAIIAKLPKPE